MTCRSMTASDISTWASGSESDITPAKGGGCCCASSILYCRSRSSCLALRLALTFYIMSLMVSAFLSSYYFSLSYFSCKYSSLLLLLYYSYFCLSYSAYCCFFIYFSCYCFWISSYLVISGTFYFIYYDYSWIVAVTMACVGWCYSFFNYFSSFSPGLTIFVTVFVAIFRMLAFGYNPA